CTGGMEIIVRKSRMQLPVFRVISRNRRTPCRGLSKTAAIEATVETGSPNVPTIHGILIHLSGHEIVVAQLLCQPQLLIALVFLWRPHIGPVVRNIRLRVEALAFPCDQRELTCRQCFKECL